MAQILCSSPKKEAELPTRWYKTIRDAQYIFSLEVESYCADENIKKIRWIMEPEIIENEGGFNIIGYAK